MVVAISPTCFSAFIADRLLRAMLPSRSLAAGHTSSTSFIWATRGREIRDLRSCVLLDAVTMTSNMGFAEALLSGQARHARAASSLDTAEHWTPQVAIASARTLRTMSCGSSSSTFFPDRTSVLGGGGGWNAEPCDGIFFFLLGRPVCPASTTALLSNALIVKENVLPFPTPSLSTHMSPPIAWHSRLLIVRPSPEPPYLRVGVSSSWEKDWNSFFRSCAAMPMPVSFTVTRMSYRSAQLLRRRLALPRLASSISSEICVLPTTFFAETAMNTSPLSVNFTALLSTFSTICCRRWGSPCSSLGTSASIEYATCRRFWAALSPAISMAASSTLCSSNSSRCSASLFASIMLKSRMSVMSVRSASPEQQMVDTRSFCAGDSAVSDSSCPTAIIPFSGVRISWLIRARNWLLASVAAAAIDAFFLASSSANLRCTSSEMSLWIPT